MTKNILFIMADQLRRDYLSCYGARHLSTPHLDALAGQGVRFTNAYVQGAVCGSSDVAGLERLGAQPSFRPMPYACEGGFEPYERDDGIWPGTTVPDSNRYARYLRSRGYTGSNPWHDWANAGRSAEGRVLSGWPMRWAASPAAVAEEHSETAYTTRRAIDFIEECGDKPWFLHLSYIKPLWPYVAPEPFIDSLGGPTPSHQIEGRSLLPMLTGAGRPNLSREYVISEGDHAFRGFVREGTRQPIDKCRMFMVRTRDWKYVHHEGLRPQLHDLRNDPHELHDLGSNPGSEGVCHDHAMLLFDWLRGRRIHPTVSHEAIAATTFNEARSGTQIGVW